MPEIINLPVVNSPTPIFVRSRAEMLMIPAGSILLTDDLYSILARWIRIVAWRRDHVSGVYNHSMIAGTTGKVLSQHLLYRERDIDRWLDRARVKVWTAANPSDNRIVYGKAVEQLTDPWRRRLYDWPGIIGQLFGCPQINLRRRYYCSERVAAAAVEIDPAFPLHPSPSRLDWYLRGSAFWTCWGIYEP